MRGQFKNLCHVLSTFRKTDGITSKMAGYHCCACFRGINVGKAKRVSMDDLRALFEELGFSNVKTLLNSGNVVFRTTAGSMEGVAARIEHGLLTRTGIRARTFVLTAAELGAIIKENQLATTDPARFLVSLLPQTADREALAAIADTDWTPDEVQIGRYAIYQRCAGGVLDSRLVQAVGRLLGAESTARNWTTFLKINVALSEKP